MAARQVRLRESLCSFNNPWLKLHKDSPIEGRSKASKDREKWVERRLHHERLSVI